MYKTILLLCCIAFASYAQRPLRWVADAASTAPVTFDCSRGETLTFAPVLKAYGTAITNYTASFQWQTNGMGTAFWSTNVLAFTPSMDCGANRYRFFIRAESTNGVIYSAQGTINMLHAPGATVNALPLPVRLIDFADVTWTNAPWLLAESDPGIPSAIAQANTNAQGYANAALSNAVLFATTNQMTRIYNAANASEYIDGAGNKYVVSNFWSMTFSPNFSGGSLPAQTNYIFTAANQWYREGWHSLPMFGGYWTWQISIGGINYFPGGFYTRDWLPTTNSLVLDPVLATGATGYAYISNWTTTNLIGTLAMEASVTASLATKVSTNDATYLATVSKANTAVQPAALSGYLPLTGGTMGLNSSITFQAQYYFCAFGDASGIFKITYTSIGVDVKLKIPDDINGEFFLATREWTTSQLAPKADSTHTNDPAAHPSLFNAKADSSRTITINGSTGTISTNLVFTLLSEGTVTNIVDNLKELHRDSYTNVIWKTVYSNGWMWLVAYTNYPAN